MKKNILTLTVLGFLSLNTYAQDNANSKSQEESIAVKEELKVVNPAWAKPGDIDTRVYHGEVGSLESKNKIIDGYIEFYKKRSEYLDLVSEVKNKELAQENNVKMRAKLANDSESGSQNLSTLNQKSFRDSIEYQQEVSSYEQQISELSRKVKELESVSYNKALKKRSSIIEAAYDNLYLVSFFGLKNSPKAEFFYRGSRITVGLGEELPGGWKVVDINSTRAVVYNKEAIDNKEREINFKDPQTVKEEIRIKREIDMEIMKKRAEVEGQIMLEKSKNGVSSPISNDMNSGEAFNTLQGKIGY